MTLSNTDRTYLRDLAKRVAEIAADPYNEERRNWWYRRSKPEASSDYIFVKDPDGYDIEILEEGTKAGR